MEDSDDIEAATEIAIQCGALERCAICGVTWTTEDFDPDDEESMAELVSAAHRKADADEDLDLPDDNDALRAQLAQAISSAEIEKSCEH